MQILLLFQPYAVCIDITCMGLAREPHKRYALLNTISHADTKPSRPWSESAGAQGPSTAWYQTPVGCALTDTVLVLKDGPAAGLKQRLSDLGISLVRHVAMYPMISTTTPNPSHLPSMLIKWRVALVVPSLVVLAHLYRAVALVMLALVVVLSQARNGPRTAE